MPEAPETPVSSLSELLPRANARRPSSRRPSPAARARSGRLLRQFPHALRPTRAARVESSSLSPMGDRLQVALVATTSLSPARGPARLPHPPRSARHGRAGGPAERSPAPRRPPSGGPQHRDGHGHPARLRHRATPSTPRCAPRASEPDVHLRPRPARRRHGASRLRRRPGRPRSAGSSSSSGVVSLLTDVSSESVAAILPLYLTVVVGLTPVAYGLIDGLYQGVSALVRLGGGWLADASDRPEVGGLPRLRPLRRRARRSCSSPRAPPGSPPWSPPTASARASGPRHATR